MHGYEPPRVTFLGANNRKGRCLMKEKLRSFCGILLLISAFVAMSAMPAMPIHASAATADISYSNEDMSARTARAAETTYSLDGISSRSVYSYPARSVSYNSTSLGSIAREINGEIYVPIRRFVEGTSSARVSYNSTTRTITVTGSGHNISVSDGAYALYANGRVFFSRTPSVILSDGRMYVPAGILARALSLSYSSSAWSAKFSGSVAPVVSGDRYYNSDELYWLSRIISAESRGEPLIGQIAVGDVVLNRVRSSAFPNTIWGVIFDRKYGVQFSPVANGTIYNTPTPTCILAAKICLEGFTVSDRVLYFLRPSASTSSWIVRNREYLFTIGNHYFFA